MGGGFPGCVLCESGGRPGKKEVIRCWVVCVLGFAVTEWAGAGAGAVGGCLSVAVKHSLRRKSDAFLTYLHNLAVTSRQHNEALADASFIPNFL